MAQLGRRPAVAHFSPPTCPTGLQGSSRREGKRDCKAPMRGPEMGFSTSIAVSRQDLSKDIYQTKQSPTPTPQSRDPRRSRVQPAHRSLPGRDQPARNWVWAVGRAGRARVGLGEGQALPVAHPPDACGARRALRRHRGIQFPGRLPEGAALAGSHRRGCGRRPGSCDSDRTSSPKVRVFVAMCGARGRGAPLELKAFLQLSVCV